MLWNVFMDDSALKHMGLWGFILPSTAIPSPKTLLWTSHQLPLPFWIYSGNKCPQKSMDVTKPRRNTSLKTFCLPLFISPEIFPNIQARSCCQGRCSKAGKWSQTGKERTTQPLLGTMEKSMPFFPHLPGNPFMC